MVKLDIDYIKYTSSYNLMIILKTIMYYLDPIEGINKESIKLYGNPNFSGGA